MQNDQMAAIVGIMLAVTCAVVIVVLVVTIFFLLTLKKALSRVSKRNRLMEPAQVFLCLIPIFNLYWNFKTVSAVSDSLKHEFSDLDADDGTDHGKNLGIIALAILLATTLVSNVTSSLNIPALQMVVGLLSLVPFVLIIIYWVKIANYSNRLQKINDEDRSRDDDDRDDDRRPPRTAAPRDRGDDGITKPRRDDRIR